jgi:hypothetical protein
VPDAHVAKAPTSLSAEEAAALPLVALTAWQALDAAALEPGQRVLVHAAAGGVGSVAVQLAKQRGLVVAATCSAGNADYVRKLGADEVIDYNTSKFEEVLTGDKQVDAVIDGLGGKGRALPQGTAAGGAVRAGVCGAVCAVCPARGARERRRGQRGPGIDGCCAAPRRHARGAQRPRPEEGRLAHQPTAEPGQPGVRVSEPHPTPALQPAPCPPTHPHTFVPASLRRLAASPAAVGTQGALPAALLCPDRPRPTCPCSTPFPEHAGSLSLLCSWALSTAS